MIRIIIGFFGAVITACSLLTLEKTPVFFQTLAASAVLGFLSSMLMKYGGESLKREMQTAKNP